jgi:hypothetical protein
MSFLDPTTGAENIVAETEVIDKRPRSATATGRQGTGMYEHSPFMSRSWDYSILTHRLSEEIMPRSCERWDEMKRQLRLKRLHDKSCFFNGLNV